MQKTFTKEFMQQNKGCYSTEELNACSFMQNEVITLDSILDSEIKTKDKFWFVCNKLATKEQNQRIAIMCAETVLHLFENKYPNDDRPRKAIQAAKDYLNGKIDLYELREKRCAVADAYAAYAADAYAAADAAYAAAYAAADATYAAAYTAAQGAAAASAAASDAADATYAAASDALHTQLIQGLKDIINQP